MKILLRVVIGLVIIVVLVVLVGFVLPSKVHVERSLVINATQGEIFDQVNDLRKWHDWSPWHAMEPSAEYKYSGPETGVGSKSSWEGEKVGTGSQEITQSERPTRIITELDFGAQGKATSEWKFQAEAEDGTKVTWGFDTELGMNPVSRYFGLFLDGIIGGNYEEGLNRLKSICKEESADGLPEADVDAADSEPTGNGTADSPSPEDGGA